MNNHLLYIAYRFIDPVPPRHFAIAAGMAGCGYDNFARQYARILARNGVELEVRNAAGAVEDLDLLRDGATGVQSALTALGSANQDPPAHGSLNRHKQEYFAAMHMRPRSCDHARLRARPRPTHSTTRVHHADRRRGSRMATPGARAAVRMRPIGMLMTFTESDPEAP